MNLKRLALIVLAGATLGGSQGSWTAEPGIPAYTPEQLGMIRYTSRQQEHIDWVGEVAGRMQGIRPGMTRKQLLEVFTTEGGLSTGLQRTYVSRDCPWFKVDVEFEAVGRPPRDAVGRVTLVEAEEDRIVKISRPYVAQIIAD